MPNFMEFERPIVELKNKISEFKKLMEDADIDFSKEVSQLENRLAHLEKEVYSNLTPWDRVCIARHPKRPTTLDYVRYLFDDFIELHGDRYFGDDAALIGGIAFFQGKPVTVIGQQRGRDTKENIVRNFGMPHPEGYRKALRLMKQAEKFCRPIITFIDTKGAYPGKAAEERGQSEAIAKNLFEMAGLTVPVIAVVIGEGGSGGALALGVANRILMLENATYSVISPEGAAALLWKDSTQAKKAAQAMQITAKDLYELGVCDEIIKEIPPGAHVDVKVQADLIADRIQIALNDFSTMLPQEILSQRMNKYLRMGQFRDQPFG
ncbi:MAG TPA: acetyl-CoA carboxylase carboxyltransferase subunit alpha [Firmicutes bacterium]|nr:acetyl-CoA carboxylase carboxyltransferase subunit alpha [Bacillales bacterium]HJA41940.1 acetyl-CoA carboxylase carboxyltransferase subunit alpha [Bacillota bacterium]